MKITKVVLSLALLSGVHMAHATTNCSADSAGTLTTPAPAAVQQQVSSLTAPPAQQAPPPAAPAARPEGADRG